MPKHFTDSKNLENMRNLIANGDLQGLQQYLLVNNVAQVINASFMITNNLGIETSSSLLFEAMKGNHFGIVAELVKHGAKNGLNNTVQQIESLQEEWRPEIMQPSLGFRDLQSRLRTSKLSHYNQRLLQEGLEKSLKRKLSVRISTFKIKPPQESRSQFMDCGAVVWKKKPLSQYEDWCRYGIKWLNLLENENQLLASSIKTITNDLTSSSYSYIGFTSYVPVCSVRYKLAREMQKMLVAANCTPASFDFSRDGTSITQASCTQVVNEWREQIAIKQYNLKLENSLYQTIVKPFVSGFY